MEEQQWLTRRSEEEEELEGIKMCTADKAPGPNGYTMIYFSNFWETIKGDILLTFHNFHTHQKFEKCFYATFVALITKKVGANDLIMALCYRNHI